MARTSRPIATSAPTAAPRHHLMSRSRTPTTRPLLALACVVISAASFVGGCGTRTITPELLDARIAYERARAQAAERADPVAMFAARKALDEAERRQQQDPGGQRAVDAAYIALRKAQLAEANTRAEAAGAKAANAIALINRRQSEGRGTKAVPEAVPYGERSAKAKAKANANANGTEKEPPEPLADALTKIAPTSVGAGNLVMTLTGDEWFAGHGDEDLTIEATTKLGVVASALRQEAPNATVEIHGFMDAIGSDVRSRERSQRRAEAVRDALVANGVARDRIVAEGRSKGGLPSERSSPEARATARRVELVITPHRSVR